MTCLIFAMFLLKHIFIRISKIRYYFHKFCTTLPIILGKVAPKYYGAESYQIMEEKEVLRYSYQKMGFSGAAKY